MPDVASVESHVTTTAEVPNDWASVGAVIWSAGGVVSTLRMTVATATFPARSYARTSTVCVWSESAANAWDVLVPTGIVAPPSRLVSRRSSPETASEADQVTVTVDVVNHPPPVGDVMASTGGVASTVVEASGPAGGASAFWAL